MILQASGNLKLLAGDQVFVTLYQQSTDGSHCSILDNKGYCFFDGNMIFAD